MRAQRRRLEQAQVLEEAMAAIAEHGLAGLTMAGLARRLGTSGGHIMYYFDSKDQLLLETLRWIEGRLSARRATALASTDLSAAERLQTFIDLYLPAGRGDPRWLLRLEVWTRCPADADILAAQTALDAAWRDDLISLLDSGISGGEFRAVHAEGYATRLLAMLDGFSTQLVIGAPRITSTAVQTLLPEHLQATLLTTSRRP